MDFCCPLGKTMSKATHQESIDQGVGARFGKICGIGADKGTTTSMSSRVKIANRDQKGLKRDLPAKLAAADGGKRCMEYMAGQTRCRIRRDNL
jgi:hypothetical protein